LEGQVLQMSGIGKAEMLDEQRAKIEQRFREFVVKNREIIQILDA
jgi:hypothetical protein